MSLLFRDDKELIREIRRNGRSYYEDRFESWDQLSKHFKIDIYTLRQKFAKACVTFKAKKRAQEKKLVKLPNIEFTNVKAVEFTEMYLEAVRENKDSFVFEGNEILTKYARYMVEQLKVKFDNI